MALTDKQKLMAGIALTFAFMLVECAGGFIAGSLALLGDAAHMLTDTASFAVSLAAAYLAERGPTKAYTYGLHRVEVLAALASTLMLWMLTGMLVLESFRRIHAFSQGDAPPVDGKLMVTLGLLGVAMNVVLERVLGAHSHGFGDHGHDHGHGHGHGNGHAAHDEETGHGGHGAHGHKDHGDHGHAPHGSHEGARDHGHAHSALHDDCCGEDHGHGGHGAHEAAHGHAAHSAAHDHHDSHDDCCEDHGHGSAGHGHGKEDHGHGSHGTHEAAHDHAHKAPAKACAEGCCDEEDDHGHGHGASAHGHGKAEDHGHGHKAHKAPSSRTPLSGAGGPSYSALETEDGGAAAAAPRRSMNIDAAYLHVLGDLLQSLGVVAAGAIILWRPAWQVADPLMTLIFAAIVLYTTSSMLVDTLRVLLEGAPENVDVPALHRALEAVAGVRDVHDLHVWQLTAGLPALSCHVILAPDHPGHDAVLARLQAVAAAGGVDHACMQVQSAGACLATTCCTPYDLLPVN